MMLSIPNTISSAVSVSSEIQICGSEIHSNMSPKKPRNSHAVNASAVKSPRSFNAKALIPDCEIFGLM
jgi:hypothetical protein